MSWAAVLKMLVSSVKCVLAVSISFERDLIPCAGPTRKWYKLVAAVFATECEYKVILERNGSWQIPHRQGCPLSQCTWRYTQEYMRSVDAMSQLLFYKCCAN